MDNANEPSTRRIIFEIPADLTLSNEEMEALAAQFRSQVVDSKAEQLMVKAKPKEKEKQVAVIAQVVEVAQPKEKQQII